MSYRYLEDIAIADVAFRADGRTIEELFAAAADAVTNTMVEDLAAIAAVETVPLRLEEPTLELLLFSFLGELVYLKDARRLLLRPSALSVSEGPPAILVGELTGEVIDTDRHRLLTDVKGVTLHRFSLERTGTVWTATVVLDV